MKRKEKWSIGFVLLPVLFGFNSIASFSVQPDTLLIQDTANYHEQYFRLKEKLVEYENISSKGGWLNISEPENHLKAGDKNPIITTLRHRLEAETYLSGKTISAPDSFDTGIETSIKLFQANNNIPVTGHLDSITVSVLNIPVEKRIEQIKINMERWKLLSPISVKSYLFINVPDFSLWAVENDSVVRKMKVIVGRTYRSTPVFQAKMTHLIFNPTWNIPSTILEEDILPLVFKDTSYLRKRHIRIYHTEKGGVRKEIPVDSVDWEAMSVKYFPYELIQDPGKDNMLGVVKFMFPNPYNIYLHDTPVKELFAETERTFSSGCIRVYNATELAGYLLKWSKKKVMKTIQSGETLLVNLTEPITVYIEYFTAWVDEKGSLQFRKDIYDRDVR